MNFYYTSDKFDETIPTKEDGSEIDRIFVNLKNQLDKFSHRQEELGVEEKVHMEFTKETDEKIYMVTMIEIVVIISAFCMEFVMLSQYLKRRELI